LFKQKKNWQTNKPNAKQTILKKIEKKERKWGKGECCMETIIQITFS